MKMVVALGGNALVSRKKSGAKKDLLKNLGKITEVLVDIIKKGNKIVVTHGSGPQAGMLLLQNEISKNSVPEMSLDVLDAEIQGQLGYLIEQSLINSLNKEGLRRQVITVLTQVIVDKNDYAFKYPTKPIGPFYTKRNLKNVKRKGVMFKEDSGRGYRRVVPSPYPLDIVEDKIIRLLINKGVIVIAGGGGGIPVCKNGKGLYGVEAVIDKDLTSGVLARKIKADMLLMITSVEKVYLNFGKKNQKGLDRMKLNEAIYYFGIGQFAEGSMAPKIRAAIEFLKGGGKKVVITNPKNVIKALESKAGTLIE